MGANPEQPPIPKPLKTLPAYTAPNPLSLFAINEMAHPKVKINPDTINPIFLPNNSPIGYISKAPQKAPAWKIDTTLALTNDLSSDDILSIPNSFWKLSNSTVPPMKPVSYPIMIAADAAVMATKTIFQLYISLGIEI